MTTRSQYYDAMRRLALDKRASHDITTKTLNLIAIKKVYRDEGIKVDLWTTSHRIRAAYFADDDGCSVLVNRTLPREPKLFSMVHELKHHCVDRESIENGRIRCGDYNASEAIEIGAEVFAGEFIYPEDEMRELLNEVRLSHATCSPERICEFKRVCPACVSYAFIVKRLEWFGICDRDQYKRVQFRKLQEQLYPPIYKQDWFKRQRARKAPRR